MPLFPFSLFPVFVPKGGVGADMLLQKIYIFLHLPCRNLRIGRQSQMHVEFLIQSLTPPRRKGLRR